MLKGFAFHSGAQQSRMAAKILLLTVIIVTPAIK